MLTLNQTPSTVDTEIIFVWQILSEGDNIITNGTFANGSNWTAGGSWSIGSGVATLDNTSFSGTSDLEQTITTTNGQSYYLEYEITANTLAGNTTFMVLAAGGSYFVDNNIVLDTSVGKHQLPLLANGGTVLGISFIQSGAGTGALSIDNVSLKLINDPIYISNHIGGITLSSISYDGAVRAYDIPTEFSEGIDIVSGGGLGFLNSMSIGIARYNTNSKTNSYFNEFYPNTGKYLTSRKVRTGFCWVGATTEAEITWLPDTYIEEIEYTPNLMTLFCVAYRELELISLPYYEIQQAYDNGMSYYPYAPSENFGRPIPFLYGNFNIGDRVLLNLVDYDKATLAPAVCVDEEALWYQYASHKIKEDVSSSVTFTSQELFKYIDSAESYLILRPESGELSNTQGGAKDYLFGDTPSAGDTVYGKIYITPKVKGEVSDYAGVAEILDDEFVDTTYLTITDGTQASVKIDSNVNQGDIGLLGYAVGDISFHCLWQSDNGGNRQITLAYWNPSASGAPANSTVSQSDTTTSTGSTWDTVAFSFGSIITSKSNTNLPWSLDEVVNLDLRMVNTSGSGATSGDINIRRAYLVLDNIIVSQVAMKPIRFKIKYQRYGGK